MASPVSFRTEIRTTITTMTLDPKADSEVAMLIEDIIRARVTNLVSQISTVLNLRSARVAVPEDLIFALRHNHARVARLCLLLNTKVKVFPATDDMLVATRYPSPLSKRRLLCLDFLSSSDNPSGNVDDWLAGSTQAIHTPGTLGQYMEVLDCFGAPFHRKTMKFREWLETCTPSEIKIQPVAQDLLGLLASELVIEVVHMACAVSLQRQVPSFSADSNLFTSPDIAIWSTIPYSYTSSPASISPGRVTGLNGPASSNSGSSSSSSSTGVSSNGGGIAFPPSPAFGCATAVLVGEPASKRSLPDAEFGVQASNGKKSPSESITGSVDVSSRGVRRHFAKPSVRFLHTLAIGSSLNYSCLKRVSVADVREVVFQQSQSSPKGPYRL